MTKSAFINIDVGKLALGKLQKKSSSRSSAVFRSADGKGEQQSQSQHTSNIRPHTNEPLPRDAKNSVKNHGGGTHRHTPHVNINLNGNFFNFTKP